MFICSEHFPEHGTEGREAGGMKVVAPRCARTSNTDGRALTSRARRRFSVPVCALRRLRLEEEPNNPLQWIRTHRMCLSPRVLRDATVTVKEARGPTRDSEKRSVGPVKERVSCLPRCHQGGSCFREGPWAPSVVGLGMGRWEGFGDPRPLPRAASSGCCTPDLHPLGQGGYRIWGA